MIPISHLAAILSQSDQSIINPPPTPPPTPTGTPFTSLSVTSTSLGTYPFSATILPLQGQVPSGQTVSSTDDTSMRASILSTFNDGSASVIVVAGSVSVSANQTKYLSIQTSSPQTGEASLTASAISSLVSNVSVAFGSGIGTASISNFSSPERIWWSNPRTICARYRVQPPTPGLSQLEAVIDIQAYQGRALVEVVVENCKMNSTNPTGPGWINYTNAVVSVNGNTIGTCNGNATPEGSHSAFRSWYASTWLGGDPSLRVTQLHTDLQKHPLLFKVDQPSTVDMSMYASDAYTPWTAGRQRATGMGAGGDHPSIGPLPQWETRALQSGDHRAWKATEVSALAVLSYNVNYRDTTTGRVSAFSDIGNRGQTGSPRPWPNTSGDALGWETAHCPDAGLMAFISRPSPVYIEIAQKVATWNGTWSGNGTPNWTSGLFGYWYQVRGRAWGMRSLAHAAFITPSSDPWRASCLTAISLNVSHIATWRSDPKAKLNVIWDFSPTDPQTHASNSPHFQNATWQHYYLTVEYHKASQSGLLSGAQQTAFDSITDWVAMQPVRWINERTDGGWRYIPYSTAYWPNGTTVYPATWAEEMSLFMTGSPSGLSGPWMTFGNNVANNYATFTADGNAGAYYPSYFWSALVVAVERNLPGASTAWNTVQTNITNLSSWRNGFGFDPRWGSTPRSVSTIITPPPPAGSPPANNTLPLISSITPLTEPLVVSNGSWSNSPTSYSYQWKRNGTNISGAVSSSYRTVLADQGTTITCTVTATNSAGSASATSLGLACPLLSSLPATLTDAQAACYLARYTPEFPSAGITTVAQAKQHWVNYGRSEGRSFDCLPSSGAPANLSAPTITGNKTLGSTLTVSTGSWSNSPTSYSYAWRRNGTAISGATSSTYVIFTADQGTTITCVVTAMNASGQASVVSGGVGITIASGPPVNISLPVISGLLFEGITLYVSSGTWSPTASSFSYQWNRNGNAISGALSFSYLVVSADRGTTLTCTVTGASSFGSVNVTSIGVLISMSNSNLGTGSQAGAYASGLWTPGKDTAGVINQSSYNLVPVSRWVEVANTSLSTINAKTLAGSIGWSTSSLGWRGLFTSWGGFAPDPVNERAWFFGGGHSDGFNNGLYRFDNLKMLWDVESYPSNRTNWSASYSSSGSATFCADSGAIVPYASAGDIGNGYFDQIYWDVPEYRPTARHVYDSILYKEDTQEVLFGRTRIWRYSLLQGKWLPPALYPGPMDGEGSAAFYNPDTKCYYVYAVGSGSANRGYIYNTDTNTWQGRWYPFWPGNRPGKATTLHGDYWVSVMNPESGGGYANPGLYFRYNRVTQQLESGTLSLQGGLNINDFVPGSQNYDGAACVYIPTINRYWLLARMADSTAQIFEINPETTPWTASKLVQVGAPNWLAIYSAPAKRIQYSATLNAVIIHNGGDTNAYIYRF